MGIMQPDACLQLWADHWMHADMTKLLGGQPASAIWLIGPDDDGTVCMAALVAMMRGSALVLAEIPSAAQRDLVLARVRAVAEACGFSHITWTSGRQTVVRFDNDRNRGTA